MGHAQIFSETVFFDDFFSPVDSLIYFLNFSDTNMSFYWTWFGDAHDLMTGTYLSDGHRRKLIDL